MSIFGAQIENAKQPRLSTMQKIGCQLLTVECKTNSRIVFGGDRMFC
jgi:hypothetical protein